MAARTVIVAGGAGYIGSHMVRALSRAGYKPVVYDDLSTGHRQLVPRRVPLVTADLRDAKALDGTFKRYRPVAVMHFAASSLVGESVQDPLKYYDNNVGAMVALLKSMIKARVLRIVFSSTAAVYGIPSRQPIREDDPKEPVNPYGRSKLMIEQILADADRAYGLRYVALRYFNACGADEAGETGEWHDTETHLIPNLLKAITGEKDALTVYGTDYPTPDGTCVRDYVHVGDLCDAHLAALRRLIQGKPSTVYNLGTGQGRSVRQIIRTAERVTDQPVPVRYGQRRAGDPPRLVASPAKARKELAWKATRSLPAILRTAWEWEKQRIAR